jgi:two-component system C4-dicarboxylate transport response regulator DctD
MLSIDTLESPTSAPTADPFILLVDDHAPSLRQLQDVVTMFGHLCVSAGSASDALVYCDARSPRVVVTDLCMPDLDGQGLARWLKARYPSLPIILVTGEELDSATLASLRQTFEEVLKKPLNVDSFLSVLERLMDAPSDRVGAPRCP